MSTYELFPRQAEVEPMLGAGPAVLNWDMRLGKTRACLNAFDKLWQRGGPQVAIIVCPSIAKGVWTAEAGAMGLQLPIVKLDGIERRRATGQRLRGLPVLILVNWEILDAHLHDLLQTATADPTVLILDETHEHCTNPANQRYTAVKALAAVSNRVWINTGTLYRTSAMDYYWQLKLLGPRGFPWYYTKIADFAQRFCSSIKRDPYNERRMKYVGVKDEAAMLEPMKPWLDRRIEELEQMPDDFVWWLDEGEKYEYAGGNDNGELSRARSELSEVKAQRTIELIKHEPRLRDEPLVVFGWHKRFTRKVATELGGLVIDGDASAERKEQVQEAFRTGKTRVVVVNIKAGGLSIDLSRARNAVFGEIDWLATNMNQAEARIRGPKQPHKVAYWYVLAFNSVDEWVWRVMLGRGQTSRRIDERLLSA